jgi:nitroreductase
MTLKAVEEDLGTCWIGAFHENEVKETLSIPEKVRVVALLPIGYPEYVPSQTPRKMREEVVVSERWQ